MNKTQFFDYLAKGGRIRVVQWHGQDIKADDNIGGVRHAEKVQSNAIKFNNGSWLYKSDINASDMQTTTIYGTTLINIGWAVYQLVEGIIA